MTRLLSPPRFFAAFIGLGYALLVSACHGDSTTAPVKLRTKIAFTSLSSVTGHGATYIMNPDGTELTLLSPTTADEIMPVISPDGRRIAFVAAVGAVGQIFVENSDGSSRSAALTTLAGPYGAFWPTWSPDGGRVVFSNDDEQKVWIMNTDGTGQRRLANTLDDEQIPALSPDGTRIAFTSARNFAVGFQVFELYLMNVDGTNPVRLTTSTGATEGVNSYPAWSPDGRTLVFARSLDSATAHLFTVNADGSGLKQLYTGPDPEKTASWSPDGKSIVFTRLVAGRWRIFVANADGSNPVNPTTPSANDQLFPNWGKAP
jgi:TolB protein